MTGLVQPGDRVRERMRTCKDGRVTTAPPPQLCLVVGDEELLANRAAAQICAAVRAADSDADVRDLDGGGMSAGELDELLSPSLFGGRRVLVVRNGQDVKKDAVAALLGYARDPDPEVCLVVM